MEVRYLKVGVAAIAALFAAAVATPASAQQSVMKECGDKWQKAKAAKKTGGKTWPKFLAECRAKEAKGKKPKKEKAAKKVKSSKNSKKANSAKPTGRMVFPRKVNTKYKDLPAGQQRMKTCADQYNANKKRGNGNGGLNWIVKGGGYWSECNKSLKS